MCPSTSNKFNSGQCCAICYYSICFSTISACSYWNDQTLSAILEHADLHYQEGLNDGKEFTCDYLPQGIDIYGADIEVVFNSRYQGEFFFTSVIYRKHLGRLILENASQNTGFLLCFSNIYLSCIFPHNKRQIKYFLVECNEISQPMNLLEQFNDIDSLINTICHIVTQRVECEEIEYDILFLLCSCQLTKSEMQKRLLDDKRKDKYANLEPVKKKFMLEKAALDYYIVDPMRKRDLRETNTQKYKSMDPMEKKVLLDSKTKIYKLSKDLAHDLDYYIYRFRCKIKEGPYYMCSVCNRLLYKKSVIIKSK